MHQRCLNVSLRSGLTPGISSGKGAATGFSSKAQGYRIFPGKLKQDSPGSDVLILQRAEEIALGALFLISYELMAVRCVGIKLVRSRSSPLQRFRSGGQLDQ